VCPEALQRLEDHIVGFIRRQIGTHDAVVVVDGDVPDHPPDPTVVALFRPSRAPGREK
jgi:hypothetical protein